MSDLNEPQTHDDMLRGRLDDPLFVQQEWQGRGIDQLLQWLVNNTNAHPNNQHSITLTVGGNLISGKLISADAYFKKMTDHLAADFSAEDGSREIFKEEASHWNTPPITENGLLPPPQFIHLEAAEIYSSNERPILPGGSLWRGKLSSVDGFNLGRLVYTAQ
ncbi:MULTISPECIES: gas vesicle accessory protein GvpU [Pseudomonas]|uniref:gas vesicle accessory protein GvpU n=1 Tax=Pseudomonas TaxID=286 RepID=UPI00059D0F75|nr:MULTISPECIES: gas vesicle accessory protein GvpU [Pseudomonas]MBB4055092.1 hypothetical protein [Pseudomonas koreensis]TSB49300.1 gas vesicle protein [Pseudomonas sp. ef1]